MANLTTIVYCTSLPIVILFALFALILVFLKQRSQKKKAEDELDEFIAAKGSQSTWRVTYGFISTCLGAWVLFGPPSYAYFTGYVGLIAYAIGASFTILTPAYFGPVIQKMTGNSVSSLSDFAYQRFGRPTQIFIAAICLYSMGVGLVAEYTGIGDVYENLVGGNRIMIVVLLGTLTSFYTAAGGLKISIMTDQIQGIMTILVFIVFFIYVLAFAQFDLSSPIPPNLDANKDGYQSLFSLVTALAASVIFSESFWQKAWAAQDPKALQRASWMASIVVFIIVFVIGFYGLLAAWSFPDKITDPNLTLFALFDATQVNSFNGIIAILIIFASIMSESTIDSYQLGIVCSISCTFMKKLPLIYTQLLVFLLNAPLIAISLQNYGIVNLFLSANLVATAGSAPILLGLSTTLRDYLKGYHVIFSSLAGLVLSFVWGYRFTGNAYDGFYKVFYYEYRWESFLISLVVPFAICLVGASIEYARQRIVGKSNARKVIELDDLTDMQTQQTRE